MTLKEASEAGIPDETDLPQEIIEPTLMEATAAAMERHLAGGASASTLCGLDRSTVSTVHPSKARKTDCEACRLKLRDLGRAKTPAIGDPANGRPIAKGDRVAWDDDSAWLVEDARDGGLDLVCLVASPAHAKGRHTTVSKDSPLRVLSDAAFSELVGREKIERTDKKPLKAGGLVDGSIAAPKASRATVVPTPEEIAKVVELHIGGVSYRKIDEIMQWPPSGGNRPFKIVGEWKKAKAK